MWMRHAERMPLPPETRVQRDQISYLPEALRVPVARASRQC